MDNMVVQSGLAAFELDSISRHVVTQTIIRLDNCLTKLEQGAGKAHFDDFFEALQRVRTELLTSLDLRASKQRNTLRRIVKEASEAIWHAKKAQSINEELKETLREIESTRESSSRIVEEVELARKTTLTAKNDAEAAAEAASSASSAIRENLDMAVETMTALEEMKAKFRSEEKKYSALLLEFESNAKNVSDLESASQKLVNKTEAYEVQSGGAAEKASQHAQLAVKSSEEAAKKVLSLSRLDADFSERKASHDKLFAELESSKNKINEQLGDANRTGIAASFRNRKKQLMWANFLWIGTFSVALFILIGITKNFIDSLPKDLVLKDHLPDLLFRLPMSAALVWLAWFAVRQYGYSRRVQEDYAYKEAAAMAFEGYKNEANAVDPTLKIRLIEVAISVLSENPIRLYEKHSNAASPLAELIEKGGGTEANLSKLLDIAAQFVRLKKSG